MRWGGECVWCRGARRTTVGGRRGGGGGAAGPPCARNSLKKRPANATTRGAVNAARAVATGAAAAPAAGASMPPRWAARRGSAARARAREGPGVGRHLGGPQDLGRSRRIAACRTTGWEGEKWWKTCVLTCAGREHAGRTRRRRCRRGQGGERLTGGWGLTPTQGACTCDDGGTKWSRPPPATGSRTPNPAGR